MFAHLRVLLIDVRKDDAEALWEALSPEIYFIERSFVGSFREALNLFLLEKVDVYLISSRMPDAGIRAFLTDVSRQDASSKMAFILVKDDLPAESNRLKPEIEGLTAVIARRLDNADKQALEEALKPFEQKREKDAQVTHSISLVAESLTALVEEVNAVARDKKRGATARYSKIFSGFIANLASFDDEVLEKYFELLENETNKITPTGFCKIQVPAEILAKNLPKLSADTYSGASRLVWEMLAKKWGVAGTACETDPKEPPNTCDKQEKGLKK